MGENNKPVWSALNQKIILFKLYRHQHYHLISIDRVNYVDIYIAPCVNVSVDAC